MTILYKLYRGDKLLCIFDKLAHLIFRLKTGKSSPSDFVFEKFVPNMFVKSNFPRKLSSLSCGDSRQILIMGRGNEQYFRRKEVLNEELKALHAKVVKGKNSFCFIIHLIK